MENFVLGEFGVLKQLVKLSHKSVSLPDVKRAEVSKERLVDEVLKERRCQLSDARKALDTLSIQKK